MVVVTVVVQVVVVVVLLVIEDACGVRPPPSRVEICELRLDLHLGGIRGMRNEVLQASSHLPAACADACARLCKALCGVV